MSKFDFISGFFNWGKPKLETESESEVADRLDKLSKEEE